jgi:hypothetical protein
MSTQHVTESEANKTATGTSATPVLSGQYVRLRQPTVGCFNVGDIKIISNGTNIAKGKTITMSSTYEVNRFPGTFLVDEIFTNFASTSCNDAGWMMVDLGSSQKIDSIVVYNRGDCCSGRMLGVICEILDSAKNVIWASDPFADKSGKTTFLPGADVTGITTYTMTPPSTLVASA